VHGIESKKRLAGIGEVLEGNELRNSGLKLHFGSKNKLHFFKCAPVSASGILAE
jgi:hypothetical protein